MPDSVELRIAKVLNGEPLDDIDFFCDYTLEEQNTSLEKQGIKPNVAVDFRPVLKETVTYVVAVLVINNQNEILMVQEAKESCLGKWYLPAGRVDKYEGLQDAAVREVFEETGLTVECQTLLKLECASRFWVRFSFIGKVIGGALKTPAEADEESLQAKWFSSLEEVDLRSKDIIPLIERAREYTNRKAEDGWHDKILVNPRLHKKLYLRLVIVIRKKTTNRIHVLLSERNVWHLPACEIHPAKSFHWTLRKFMVELFGYDVPAHKPHGVLSVEHDPSKGDDGFCISLLVVFKAPLEEVSIIGKCVWHETSEHLGDQLIARVSQKNSTVPIN